jgi:hypothetical protein
VQCNPAVRSLYLRVVAKHPEHKAIAIGHAMRKLLHLAFALWKTDRPFDPAYPARAKGAGGVTVCPALLWVCLRILSNVDAPLVSIRCCSTLLSQRSLWPLPSFTPPHVS